VFLTVLDVNVDPMVAVAAAEPVLLEEPVMELDTVSVTETVSERNVEMTDVTLVTSVISVDLNKFAVVTSDALVSAHPTAETPTEQSEFVVTTVASDLAENAPQLLDKTFDAEMDNVSADLHVTKTLVDLMVVDPPVELVPEMPHVLTDNVLTQFLDVVEMVFVELEKIPANVTLIVVDVVLTASVRRTLERQSLTVSKIVLPLC